MQVFGNVATQPEVKKSKASGKAYFEFRLAESQRGVGTEPTWYSVRVMTDSRPLLDRGDFVKVTGKLGGCVESQGHGTSFSRRRGRVRQSGGW